MNIFYLEPRFLEPSVYKEIEAKLPKFKYRAAYQPAGDFYGNRFQAFPCYEYDTTDYDDMLIPRLEAILNKHIERRSFSCLIRKSITEEVKKSKVNTPYAIIHRDDRQLAAVLYFNQTSDGGTVFFENEGDKYPDISFGAYPNRCLIYNAQRNHAIATDFTYDVRYILSMFFNLEK